jgi:hypothetical protein
VTLANESAMMTPAELASEAERIGRVQVRFDSWRFLDLCPNAARKHAIPRRCSPIEEA